MKTLQQVKERGSKTIDGRDFERLACFIPVSELESFGLVLQEGFTHNPIPFTREAVLKNLERDVAFGFEKALEERAMSVMSMSAVVRMWNWILEEGLEESETGGYALFEATAQKYGFPIPSGLENPR